MRAGLALAALLVGLGGPARAEPDATPADAQRMASLFDAVCLRAFPDGPATDRAVQEAGGVALTPAQVRELLHDDPGHGWRLARPEATYLLTIENPPWHACALRRMTRTGLPTVAPYDAAIGRYAAARGRSLGAPVGRSTRQGALDIRSTVQEVPDSVTGGVTDSVMLFWTAYLNAPAGAPEVEVRFVHQLRSPGVPP